MATRSPSGDRVALADFDRGQLWRALGYASLFDFLIRELGLSKSAASFRKGETSSCRFAAGAPTGTRPDDARAVDRGDDDGPTADLSRLDVTVSRRFLEKLEAARAALSHSHPGASADEILEAGLDLLLARDAKRKGLVGNPRNAPPHSDDPGHVPRARPARRIAAARDAADAGDVSPARPG